ncbi:uncharacterized protein LOC110841693 isoform X2 [Folsomia candida]|uniref:uncharacterized protein LOC110841693 isoform X2 n=1 Tax=Folsomia candida TaxID=158441 RepID=UPI000B8F63B3|nr:uncharacterized protein LOC110841693 isoform X2 [Folsomia candida]
MGSDTDSDSEAPEVVSTHKAKTEREQEIMGMFLQKRKIRDEQKLKRKAKAEKFAAQKKKLRQQKLDEEHDDPSHIPGVNLDSNKEILVENAVDTNFPDDIDDALSSSKKKISRKFYPKYNVSVDSLTKISNPRATTALNFKEKRLARAHREQVTVAVSSYKEKMLVKNK